MLFNEKRHAPMKKILMFILIISFSLVLTSCQAIDKFFTDKSKLQELSFTEEEGLYLILQDKEYEFYGSADSELIGDWFGTIENEEYMRVYLCDGQEPEEWIIVLDSTMMGTYTLYKEVSVTEIPEEFKAYKLEP